MKPSGITKIGLIVLGVALLLWVVLMLMSSGATKTDGAKGDDKHCPRCGRELSKAAIAKGECPGCLMEHGPEKAKLKPDSSFGTSRAIPIALIGVFCILLAVHFGLALRNRSGGSKEEVHYYVRCNKCGRKLRFRPRQIGHMGKCPLCEKPIMFPMPEEEENSNRFLKIVQSIWG